MIFFAPPLSYSSYSYIKTIGTEKGREKATWETWLQLTLCRDHLPVDNHIHNCAVAAHGLSRGSIAIRYTQWIFVHLNNSKVSNSSERVKVML